MPWDKIKGLWTDWNPTQAEAVLWRTELGKYDPELARRAVAEFYKETGRFRRPDWRGLEQIIRKLAQQSTQPGKTEFFYIAFICQETGKKHAGYFEQFCWVAKWDTIKEAWQVPTQGHLAARCRGYETEHGGRWVSMMTPHYPDIRRKARQFKVRPEIEDEPTSELEK